MSKQNGVFSSDVMIDIGTYGRSACRRHLLTCLGSTKFVGKVQRIFWFLGLHTSDPSR